MSSRAFVPACLWLLAVSGAALAEPKRHKVLSWAPFAEEEGVTLFRGEVPGSDIVALRGEGLVDAAPLLVGSVLVDVERATEWSPRLRDARLVRRVSPTEYVRWDRVAMPFPFADREFVFKVRLEGKSRDKLSFRFYSVKDPAAPKTDCVRAELFHGSYALTAVDGGRKTRLSVEVLCDPKGLFAKWLMGSFQKTWPYETISNLRRQVDKGGLIERPELAELLAQEAGRASRRH